MFFSFSLFLSVSFSRSEAHDIAGGGGEGRGGGVHFMYNFGYITTLLRWCLHEKKQAIIILSVSFNLSVSLSLSFSLRANSSLIAQVMACDGVT